MKIFIFLSLIITIIWFRGGLIFGGGEEGLPFYNPSKYFSLVSNIWYDANGGYPVILHLPRAPYFWLISQITQFGISPNILQEITFFSLIFIGCISVVYLTKELISENNHIPSIAGIFYLLNPYSMSQIWSRGIYAQFFAFALIPAFLYFYIKSLKSKKLIYLGLAIVINFILSSTYVVITNVIVLWIPVFLYFLMFLYDNRANKNYQYTAFSYTVILLILWVLTNFWWMLPTVSNASNAYYHFLTGSNNLDSLRGMSQMYFKPLWVIRLLQGFIFFLSNAYNNVYSQLSFRLLSWYIPIVATFSLIYLKTHRALWFIIILWLIGFSFSIGTNPPTGGIFTWFFTNLQFLQAFRNPYEKAGLLLMLPYAILFAVGWSWLFEKSRIVASTIIVGVCGILVWPMWTGGVTNAWVKVPGYYKEADKWISSQAGDYKIIQMPLIAGDGVRYDWNNTYQGIEPSEFLFNTSSIGRNVAFNKIYYNVLLKRFGILTPRSFGPDPDISNSEFASPDSWQELNKLAVRYIVFHRDYDSNTLDNKSTNTKINLDREQNIEYVRSFGKLDIYKVKNPNNVSRLYSPNGNIEIIKKSVDFYKFKASSDKPLKINLLDLYDPNWEMFINDKKVNTHSRVFSYANSWNIENAGDYEVILKYSPQEKVWMGWKVSLVALMVVFIGIITSKYYEYRK